MKMKNRIVFFIILYLLLNICKSFALVSGEDGGGFLKKGIGARPLGMGMAYVSVSDDANSTYWNPAGLGLLERRQITSMTTNMFDIKYNNIVYAQKIKSGGFGIFWLNADSGAIENYDINMNLIGTFTYSADAYYLSYGREIIKNLYAGLSLKYISQKLYDASGDGFGFDMGLLYKYNDDLTIGLNFQDITETKIKWDKSEEVVGSEGAEDKILRNIKFGVSYKYKLRGKPLLLAVDIDKAKNRKEIYHIGTEYQLNEMLILRLGLDDGDFSCGVGIKI
jgi:long-subunit fatty acid transport protein